MSFMLLGILNSQAAGGGGEEAFDLIQTINTTSTGTVSFGGLGSLTGYKHLQFRMVMANSAQGTGTMNVYVNGVTSGAPYSDHNIRGFDTGAVYAQGSGNSNYPEIALIGGANEGGAQTSVVVDVYDFASTSKNTTFKSRWGVLGSSNTILGTSSAAYYNTAAATAIDFKNQSNWTNVKISMYGIKG